MVEALGQTILKLRNRGLIFAIIEHEMDVIAQLLRRSICSLRAAPSCAACSARWRATVKS
jgi:hypothetical protein